MARLRKVSASRKEYVPLRKGTTTARAGGAHQPAPAARAALQGGPRMEQPAGLPAYRAVAAAARLSLPSADTIGSYSPDARRLSEPFVVWPSMGGPVEPLSRGDDRLFRATSIGTERHAMGPPSTSAASCSRSTPAPLIRLSASATEPTARHEAVCTPPALRTPMAYSSHELAWSPTAAVAALLCHPQQGEGSPHGSPPETRGSAEQTKYVFGSTMFARDGAQSACRTSSRSPSSSPPHSGGEVATARSLPRQLEAQPPASAGDRARQPSSFRSLEREAAALGARSRGEWARLPPDRPTHASSGWARSKSKRPQRGGKPVTPTPGFL